jgi:ribonuclease HI
MNARSESIKIYTDGSSKGNPGPGGFGVIMQLGKHVKEFSVGYRLTTNNRMELGAVIFALEQLKSANYVIEIYSDSKYVIDAITKGWVFGWKAKGFKGKKNSDLWLKYLSLHDKYTIHFHWVKGHNGHPENERCDQLAVEAAEKGPHLIDLVFETNQTSQLD